MILSLFFRKLIRDLARNKAQAVAVITITAAGILVFSGLLMAHLDFKYFISDYYKETNYEDFQVEVLSAPEGMVEELESIPNVNAVEGRIVRELPAQVDGSRLTLKVISASTVNRPAVNDISIEDGRYFEPGERGACIAEYHIGSEFDMNPGDEVTIQVDGSEIPLRVCGIAATPEFLRQVQSRKEFVGDAAQYGLIFVPEEDAGKLMTLKDGDEAQGTYNQFLFDVIDTGDLDSTISEAQTILQPYGIIRAAKGTEEPCAALMEMDTQNMKNIALFFSVLILLVALLAVFITVTRMVASHRRETGVVRALGYGRRPVVLYYLAYSLLLGAAGGMAGAAGGYFFSRFLLHVYSEAIDLPPIIETPFYWYIAFSGVAVALLFTALGALLPAWRSAGMRPGDAIRNVKISYARKKTSGEDGFLERLGIPTWIRLSLRNLVRNPGRTVLACIGVSLALASLICTVTMVYSFDYSFTKYGREIMKWSVSAEFSGFQPEELLDEIRAVDDVDSVEPVISFPARLSGNGESIDLEIQAYQQNSAMHGLFPTGDSSGEPGAGQIVLNRGITRQIPLKQGDRVNVESMTGTIELEVAGFVAEPLSQVGYVNLDYLQSLLGGPQFNVAMVNTNTGKEEEVATAISALPGVSIVLTGEHSRQELDQLLGAVKNVMNVIYIMMLLVCFAIVFSIVTVNVLERSQEMATERMIGAGKLLIHMSTITETLTIGLVAVTPGIILGRYFELLMMENILGTSALSLDAVFPPGIVTLFVIAFLFTVVLAGFFPTRKILRMDLAAAAKERVE